MTKMKEQRWKGTDLTARIHAGWKGTAEQAAEKPGFRSFCIRARLQSCRQGLYSLPEPASAGGRKRTNPIFFAASSAVPTSARSNLDSSPGLPRLKPNSRVAEFRWAKVRRFRRLLPCVALMLLATGCSRAPSFNLLGSFFPAWLLCGVLGIALTVVARAIFVRTNFEKELAPLILVYPCLAAFFTFSIWLLFFS